ITLFLVLIGAGVTLTAAAVIIHLAGVPADAAEHDPVGTPILLLAQIVLDALAVGAAAWMSLGKYHLSIAGWRLRPRRPFDVGRCAAVLVAAFTVLIAYSAVVSRLGISDLEPRENVPDYFFTEHRVIPFALLLVIGVAPVAEELFFRGFLFQGIVKYLGLYGAAAVSGALFALIHVNGRDSLGLIIPFTVIGLLFAVLVGKTGSIYNSIVVHFSFNLISALG